MKIYIMEDEQYCHFISESKHNPNADMPWYNLLFCKFAQKMNDIAQDMMIEAVDKMAQPVQPEPIDYASYCYECNNTKKILIHSKGCNDDRSSGHCSLCFAVEETCPHCTGKD